ncbi:Uncharacterized protein FVE85_6345 [Porphyridium purpureum]|uniref:Uncharacterized protein n=1 Tax=Porphyridium purpureum TaxID=35688 RepID=A0A5J4Z697_PORPP|nr:Uncharacterized protein FVE85_6345 [Porphyridium purpureum]|eukprot:POR2159..scf295_1
MSTAFCDLSGVAAVHARPRKMLAVRLCDRKCSRALCVCTRMGTNDVGSDRDPRPQRRKAAKLNQRTGRGSANATLGTAPPGCLKFRVYTVKLSHEEYRDAPNRVDLFVRSLAQAMSVPFSPLASLIYGKDKTLVRSVLDNAIMRGRPVGAILKEEAGLQGTTTPDVCVEIVRKSFDCRKRKFPAKFVFVVDVLLDPKLASMVRVQQGTVEPLDSPATSELQSASASSTETNGTGHRHDTERRVVVVGAGPAGLFAALALAESGAKVTLLERGKPVESRGRDIGRLQNRRILDENSNFAFGEGGAGTWSDGKLTTRIGKNSLIVRAVLETLVRFGAPDSILVSGKPHLGTDRLVRLLRNLRACLEELGVDVRFETRVENLIVKNGVCKGVHARTMDQSTESFYADSVILATGHSAHAISYGMLSEHGVRMEQKPTAMGFRIEHPQSLVNEMSYGAELAQHAFSLDSQRKSDRSQALDASIPVADYRLAAHDVLSAQAPADLIYSCWSFCMCPGGQIVCVSTNERELCVNGMSFSARQSKWANSGFVCTVGHAEYASMAPYAQSSSSRSNSTDPGHALAFQKHIERRAAEMGGGSFVAPAQRVLDFMERRTSSEDSLPSCSYRLGVRSAPLHELYPDPMNRAFIAALERFERTMPGYLSPDALLVGPESRTSSPVRVVRDSRTCEAVGQLSGLYPCGEGAGAAGGIISAAIDGIVVASSIISSHFTSPSPAAKDDRDASLITRAMMHHQTAGATFVNDY